MSERRTLVEQATAKMAEFNRANQDRIRTLQNSGGSDLDPAGFNPDTETVRRMIMNFEEEQQEIYNLLDKIFRLEPEEPTQMQGSAWPDEYRWGL